MGRAPCCEKMGLKKGPWSPEEDRILMCYIQQHGHPNWRALPKRAGLLRCGKSCRLRWVNYLKPDIRRGNFTKEEEEAIINLHELMGNRWSAIAAKLPGRTDNEIKNVWHTHLKKRLNQTNSNNNNNSTTKKNQAKPQLKEATPVSSTVTQQDDSNNDYDVVQLVQSPQDSSTNTSAATATTTSTTNTNDQLSTLSSSSSSAAAMMQSFIEIDESFWSEFATAGEDVDMINSYFDMCDNNNHIDTTAATSTVVNNDELFFLDTLAAAAPPPPPSSVADDYYYPAVGYDEFGFETDDHAYQQVQIAAIGIDVHNNNNNNNNNASVVLGGDVDVDFWYNVFVTAGGSPELQEF